MTSASTTIWETAQYLEREYQISKRKKRIPMKPSQYLNRKFSLKHNFFNGKTILEIGCTTYGEIHTIRRAFMKVGIDPLANIFGSAYPRCTEHIQGRGEELPFKDESFDAIICINTFDHTQNPYKVLEEIRRCLRRAGSLLFYVNSFSISKTIRKRLHIIDTLHPHHFSDGEVSYMFQQLGFKINRHKYKKVGFDFGNKSADAQPIKGGAVKQIITVIESIAKLLFGLGESWYMCSL